MKHIFIILLNVIVGLSQARSATISGTMKGLDIKSCTVEKKKCFKLTTKEAIMSQFLPIYTFKEYKLEITENGLSRSLMGQFGYIDLVQKQIVVRQNQSEYDYSIKMNTLEEMDFSK